MSHSTEFAARTVAFPSPAAAGNFFPGSVKDPTDSNSPLDIYLGTGRISRITLAGDATTPRTISIYDYKTSSGQLIRAGTAMAANAITAVAYDQVTGVLDLTLTNAIPDRAQFKVTLASMSPSSLDGTHVAARTGNRTIRIKAPKRVGTVAVAGTAAATFSDYGRLVGVGTAAVYPGRSRDGVTQNLFECYGTGGLPAGLSSANRIWSWSMITGAETVELEPEVICTHGMIIRVDGRLGGDTLTVSYVPNMLGAVRKQNMDIMTEFALPLT